MYLLDTDHLSLLQRGTLAGRLIVFRLANSGVPFRTTIITYQEQTRGWLSHLARARNFNEQVAAYQLLQQHAVNYRDIPIVAFDQAAVQTYQRLQKAYPRLATMDLKIAAIAMTHSAILLTTLFMRRSQCRPPRRKFTRLLIVQVGESHRASAWTILV